jgi:hypothetical protein
MSTPCPDCGGSGYQPGGQVECLRCDGYGRLRLTQRETAPVLLNRPWPYADRDLRYARQIVFMRWLAWGLAWMLMGLILGKLIL